MRPPAEKLVAKYLRTETGLRVVAKTPDDTTISWVRLTQLAAPQQANSRADHLVAFYMQLDCYAGEDGGEPEADSMQRAVCEALARIDEADHADGEVTAGRIENSTRNPDLELEPARERFIVTATVYAHS
jgi:hypothetical protein